MAEKSMELTPVSTVSGVIKLLATGKGPLCVMRWDGDDQGWEYLSHSNPETNMTSPLETGHKSSKRKPDHLPTHPFSR